MIVIVFLSFTSYLSAPFQLHSSKILFLFRDIKFSKSPYLRPCCSIFEGNWNDSITTVYCNYLYLEVQHRSRKVKTCLVVFLRGIFFVKLIHLCFVSAKNLIAALLQVKKRKRLSVDKALNHEWLQVIH